MQKISPALCLPMFEFAVDFVFLHFQVLDRVAFLNYLSKKGRSQAFFVPTRPLEQ